MSSGDAGPAGVEAQFVERVIAFENPVPLDQLLQPHRRGPGDPTHRRLASGHWLRASRTPDGPVLLRLASSAAETGPAVAARAWGPGADWALAQLPGLLGALDDPTGFTPLPEHPALVQAHRQFPNLRIGRTDLVWESLAPACLEQVVTGKEAFRAYRLLVGEFGELAPGPAQIEGSVAAGMRVPPAAEVWARIPTWKFLAAGVEQRRYRTLVGAAARARALERTVLNAYEINLAGAGQIAPDQNGMAVEVTTQLRRRIEAAAVADRALQSLPGIGPWTSAEVRVRACGDADAWSIGDYHVAKDITYALVGKVLDDDACLEILRPYAGHRARVQALIALGVGGRPRRGPRMSLPTHTPYATGGHS